MRSTRATAAVERLKRRSDNADYSFILGANGLFQLVSTVVSPETPGAVQKIGEPLPLDDFVAYVNAYGPQIPRRMTKSDIAFEKQLVKKKL
ncbi:MAG: hypothetical protein V4695_06005 [Pseudomonadota bacterium]